MLGIKRDRKGISPIIATVLLILITLALIAILWVGVRYFVSEKTSSLSDCSQADITLNPDYVCYDSAKKVMSIGISKGTNNINISRLQFVFSYDNADQSNIQETIIGINSKKIMYFNMSGIFNGKQPKKVSLIPIIVSKGKEKNCGTIFQLAVKNCTITNNFAGAYDGWLGCKTNEDCIDKSGDKDSQCLHLSNRKEGVCCWKGFCSEGAGITASGGGGGGGGGEGSTFVSLGCVPDCTGKTCGDDGCKGSCGSCGVGEKCNPYGTCNKAAIQITAGGYGACALLSDGNIKCFGANYQSGNAIQISEGQQHTCALLSNRNVQCFGGNSNLGFEELNIPASVQGNAVQITAGRLFSCVLDTKKDVTCWGYNAWGWANNYKGGDAVSVSAGEFSKCILLENNSVICYGDLPYEGSTCILENNIWKCHGLLPSPNIQEKILEISVGGMGHSRYGCALLENGNVKCWWGGGFTQVGIYNYAQIQPYNGGDAVSVSVGSMDTCVLLKNGNVKCSGEYESYASEGYTKGDAIQVAVGTDKICILTNKGDANCWLVGSHFLDSEKITLFSTWSCKSDSDCPGQKCSAGACVCVPSCTGKSCGSDGCGGESCGSCASGICYNSKCCVPKTCSPGNCGIIDDGCGGSLNCGKCSPGQICNNNNQCCVPKTCSPGNCGTISDNCGGSLICGKCSPGQICNNNNQCCVPKTCSPGNCGTISDNCGGSLDCGTCKAGVVCLNNQCCVPKTCSAGDCGTMSNNCGGSLNCGKCSPGHSCISGRCV
jgi:flagellin-like protein